MIEPLPFKPDYAVKPGETITECLKERGQTIKDLADAARETLDYLTDVIEARKPITEELAEKLQKFFGVPAGFWIRRQDSYDSDVYRLFWERCRVKPNLFAHLTDGQLEAIQAVFQCVDENAMPSREETEFYKDIDFVTLQLDEEFDRRFFPE